MALGRSRRVRARPEANHIAHRDAWKGVEGTSQDDAMAKYVEKLLEVSRRRLSRIAATAAVAVARCSRGSTDAGAGRS